MDDSVVNWRSKSFKVIDFSCNRKPTYDFLLLINCHLSSILHWFRDISSQSPSKITLPQFEPPIEGTPFEFRHQTWQAKSWGIGLHFSENWMILTLAVLSQYTGVITDDRQTTSYDNSRTCNVIATFCYKIGQHLWTWACHIVCLWQLFTLVIDGFIKCRGSVKEMTRWANEIYVTFLAEQAVSLSVMRLLCLW